MLPLRTKQRAYTPMVRFDETCFSPLTSESQEPTPSAPKAFSVTLSDDQETAYKALKAWMKKPTGVITLGGYAGSGKSTLISLLASDFAHKRIAFCALTGKATNVLRHKMRALGLTSPSHVICTLHSLLYQCFATPEGELRWRTKTRDNFGRFDIIVIDEASMVSDAMLEQLQRFDTPIVAVGDHGQLAPVGGSGKLMRNPTLRLETIHRQARGNPILELASTVRQTGVLPRVAPKGDVGSVAYVKQSELSDLLSMLYRERSMRDVATLCWKNETRVRINQEARKVLGRSPSDIEAHTPVAGDQVVVLKNAFRLAFNGMRGELAEVVHLSEEQGGEHYFDVGVDFADERIAYDGTCCRAFFGRKKMPESFAELEAEGLFVEDWQELGMLLDFGYALTVHKAQGSQFDSTVLVNERISRCSADEARRWLYTGITRAQDRLFVAV